MKYILETTLEHIAFVKIVITLWNQKYIRASMIDHLPLQYTGNIRELWLRMEDDIQKKVQQLPLPELFKKKLIGYVNPIGVQILNWMEYHGDLYFNVHLPNELCWTPKGTVDNKKTAEILIKDENLDVTKRYKLACNYCFEDDIRELWEKIPEDKKKTVSYREGAREDLQQGLVFFWTYIITKDETEIENMFENRFQGRYSPNRYALGCAADDGNKVATEYFLQKLTPEEREESLLWAATFVRTRFYDGYRFNTDIKKYYTEVLCFLLSQLEEQQQIMLIKGSIYYVLKSFLDWPYQSFFMDTVNLYWNFLDGIHYHCLLELIIHQVKCGCKDWNYQALFGEFWRQSPNSHKKYCIDRCISGILPDLFRIGDIENIRLILKSATDREKEEIIFNYNGKNICEDLVYKNEYDTLEFFLKECISSSNAMLRFKMEFKDHIELRHSEEKLEKERDMWDTFLHQFLDDLELKRERKE